jgi:hypothetical protein
MRHVLPLILMSIALAGCQPKPPQGIDLDRMAENVGQSVGDPGTCVLLVRKSDAKPVWRYGLRFNCLRPLPDCSGSTRTANDLASVAARGDRIAVSCASVPDASRQVSWATGSAGAPSRDLAFVAMMELTSERSLPGREMVTRLNSAFARSGLGTEPQP